MVEHTVWREQNGYVRMKILCLYNSYHTPGVDDRVFACETDLPSCCGHQVPSHAVETLPPGARE